MYFFFVAYTLLSLDIYFFLSYDNFIFILSVNKKIIVTLGPSLKTSESLKRLVDIGVSSFRVNLSHSDLAELYEFSSLSDHFQIPLAIDTQGAQIRSRLANTSQLMIHDGDILKIYSLQSKCKVLKIHVGP